MIGTIIRVDDPLEGGTLKSAGDAFLTTLSGGAEVDMCKVVAKDEHVQWYYAND